MAGITVGIVTGSTWFYIVDSVFTPYFQQIANT